MPSDLPRPIASPLERSAIRAISRRLLPFLGLLLVVNFIDRTNLSLVAPRIMASFGMSLANYGFAVGIFYAGYLLLEVPSNIALHRFGARRWICRIMLSWGLVAMCMGVMQSASQFYLLRGLLGAAEAGFYPGIIYYLSLWYPRRYRARVAALFYLGVPIAQVIGNPLTAALVDLFEQRGLNGWRFAFLIEGLPAILLAFAVLRWLADGPAQVPWLTPEQRGWLGAELARERQGTLESGRQGFWRPLAQALATPGVLALAFIYLGITAGSNTLNYFLPNVLQTLRSPLGAAPSLWITGLLTALPYAVAAVAMVWWTRHSDRSGERRVHIALAAALAAIAATSAVLIHTPLAIVLGFTVMTAAVYSALNVFWSVPADLLGGAGAAAAIGLINSIGNFSGFLAPYAMGQLYRLRGSYTPGFLLVAVLLLLAAIGTLWVLRRPTGAAERRPA